MSSPNDTPPESNSPSPNGAIPPKNDGDDPFILVCNDDGIDAPGIHALAGAMTDLGDVCVIAPQSEQSAVGHAITVRDPIRAHQYTFRVGETHVPAWAVGGTPADCIKLALHQILDRRPDLVVSGINRGPNTAVNVLYSGTVSAATEASILGIDAIAFSQCDWTSDDYQTSATWARRIAERVLVSGLRPGVLLNVNVPYEPDGGIRGLRVTRQAKARWEESFDARTDPLERDYFWLAGTFVNLDEGDETDLDAIDEGYVSVTPVQHDMTAYDALDDLREWTWEDETDVEDGRG